MNIYEILAQQQKTREAFQLPKGLQTIADQYSRINALTNPLTDHPLQKWITHHKQINKFESLFAIIDTVKKIDTLSTFNKLNGLIYHDIDLKNETEEPETSVAVTIDESNRVKRIITDIYNDNKILLTIEPRQFEEMIAELLSSQGFHIELTKQTRDNGYDIIAIKDIKHQSPLKFLVECKRYVKGKVGIEVIRSFREVVMSENANRGIIATTSYFTKDAIKKQKQTPYLLDYRDKDAVMEWVYAYKNIL